MIKTKKMFCNPDDPDVQADLIPSLGLACEVQELGSHRQCLQKISHTPKKKIIFVDKCLLAPTDIIAESFSPPKNYVGQ